MSTLVKRSDNVVFRNEYKSTYFTETLSTLDLLQSKCKEFRFELHIYGETESEAMDKYWDVKINGKSYINAHFYIMVVAPDNQMFSMVINKGKCYLYWGITEKMYAPDFDYMVYSRVRVVTPKEKSVRSDNSMGPNYFTVKGVTDKKLANWADFVNAEIDKQSDYNNNLTNRADKLKVLVNEMIAKNPLINANFKEDGRVVEIDDRSRGIEYDIHSDKEDFYTSNIRFTDREKFFEVIVKG